jgi:hypothetical protein
MFIKIYKLYKILPLLVSGLMGYEFAPILMSKDGKILDGNSRLLAAKILKRKIKVVIIDSDTIEINSTDLETSY